MVKFDATRALFSALGLGLGSGLGLALTLTGEKVSPGIKPGTTWSRAKNSATRPLQRHALNCQNVHSLNCQNTDICYHSPALHPAAVVAAIVAPIGRARQSYGYDAAVVIVGKQVAGEQRTPYPAGVVQPPSSSSRSLLLKQLESIAPSPFRGRHHIRTAHGRRSCA